MPAASPSSPSMRLMAFVMPMTQSAVSKGVTSGESRTVPASGILSQNIVAPRITRTIAANT